MSAGHFDDPIPFTFKHAEHIVSLSAVARLLAHTKAVDRTYDIPYLAGYSNDGHTIYIDRDLWTSKFHGADYFLYLHEDVEKSIIDAIRLGGGERLEVLLKILGMAHPNDRLYYHAHGVATAIEEHGVEKRYGSRGLESYKRFMKEQVKRAEDERIIRVPADLDMTPYHGDDRMDRKLREIMEKGMVAHVR
jgi:hypothetical protein